MAAFLFGVDFGLLFDPLRLLPSLYVASVRNKALRTLLDLHDTRLTLMHGSPLSALLDSPTISARLSLHCSDALPL